VNRLFAFRVALDDGPREARDRERRDAEHREELGGHDRVHRTDRANDGFSLK